MRVCKDRAGMFHVREKLEYVLDQYFLVKRKIRICYRSIFLSYEENVFIKNKNKIKPL